MNLTGYKRECFPAVQKRTYLMTASTGPWPVEAAERLRQYADIGVDAEWYRLGYSDMLRVGDKIAALLGAEPNSVSFHMNSTIACAVAMSCFEPSARRNKIVFTEGCFTSHAYLAMQQERIGAEVVVVPLRDGIGPDMEELLSTIDESTLFVPVSHVFFRNGYVLDAEAVCRRAEEVGAYVILDVYQSAGVVPLRCKEWGVHFAVGGCGKWLCGGLGAAFLYVRPDLATRLLPKIIGAAAHASPDDFDIHRFEPRESPFRFMNGAHAMAGIVACEPGLDIILEAGLDAIRDNSLRMTDRLIEGAKSRGFSLRTPEDPKHRGGAISMLIPGDQRVVQELAEKGILVDFRPGGGIRVSPHFYNTEDDLDRFFASVDCYLSATSAIAT